MKMRITGARARKPRRPNRGAGFSIRTAPHHFAAFDRQASGASFVAIPGVELSSHEAMLELARHDARGRDRTMPSTGHRV